jgi:hypothetical protein
MSRSGESVTRLDIRFPNEMYDQMQQIAINGGARTHHISQKVEVSPTVIKLVQLGLDALNGKLPDTSGDISDNLSGNSSSVVSDRKDSVSDIPDKRIETIVDRRLAELGLFPDCQTEDNFTPHSLPDKVNTILDSLSDKGIIISDKTALVPDSLPDTENIPSDVSDCNPSGKPKLSVDSSNSESIAEDTPITQAEDIAIENYSNTEDDSTIPAQSYSFADFHDWLDLPRPGKRNKANGAIAISIAESRGLTGWVMNSSSYRFTKNT